MKSLLLFAFLLIASTSFGQMEKVFISHQSEVVNSKLIVTITNTGSKPYIYSGCTIITTNGNGNVLTTDNDKQTFVIKPNSYYRFAVWFNGNKKDLISINLYR